MEQEIDVQDGPFHQWLFGNGCDGGVHQSQNPEFGGFHDAQEVPQPAPVVVAGNRNQRTIDWWWQDCAYFAEVGVDEIRWGEVGRVRFAQGSIVQALPKPVVDAAGEKPLLFRRSPAHDGRWTVQKGNPRGWIGGEAVRCDGQDSGVRGFDGDQVHGSWTAGGVTWRCCTSC